MIFVALSSTLAGLVVCTSIAAAQLPSRGNLSAQDEPLFRAEIARLERVLKTAADPIAVTWEIARTWAAGKQWPEAREWMKRAVDTGAGIDPSRERLFAEIRDTAEFKVIVAAAREATPPIVSSERASAIAEGRLAPESMAYDPAHGVFYFGSMRMGKVLACSPAGECSDFATGLQTVLGMKVRNGRLWLLNNSPNDSALIVYDLSSGEQKRRIAIDGSGHVFNDLVFGPSGELYLTDTKAGAVWRLSNGASTFTRLPGRFQSANGIAISPDGHVVYVSSFPDGITVYDVKTMKSAPIQRPSGICLAAIDGLYWNNNSLIAIQNGYMSPRVVRMPLDASGRGIRALEILERRNPQFDGVTTGVVVDQDFYFMANIQDDERPAYKPIVILKLRLPRWPRQ